MIDTDYAWKEKVGGRFLTPRADPYKWESPADLLFRTVDEANAWFMEEMTAQDEGEDDAEVAYMRLWVLCRVTVTPTATTNVKGDALIPGHTLVGDDGGLSQVHEIDTSSSMPGLMRLETEHGPLYLDPDEDQEIVTP